MGVYSPAQHWHRVEGALAQLGEEGTRVTRDTDNTSVSLAWVMEDISAEGKQTIDKHEEFQSLKKSNPNSGPRIWHLTRP